MKRSGHRAAANPLARALCGGVALALLAGCHADPASVFTGEGGEGSIMAAMLAALAFVGGLLVERVLLEIRPSWYFDLGFELRPELVPLADRPEGRGQTSTVSWEVVDEVARFWAEPGRRAAPMGLHGSVRFVGARGRWRPVVRWAPPWSPLLAALWLAGIGAVRGEAWLTVPIAAVMVVGVVLLYRQVALRAAAELRWRWVSSADDEGGSLLD